jgi:hypothetical protein
LDAAHDFLQGENMAEIEQKQPSRLETGQALVEYSLIVVLCILAFGFALAATGPAIGNVFSNTVYNLLGQENQTILSLPNNDDFWLTVTWVATQTPVERPLPQNTIAPPTASYTPGPSPTPTPVTPTKTFTPTYTPSPSPTLTDIGHEAPWYDSAEESQVNFWRLENANNYFGSEDWSGAYYNNTNFSGLPGVKGFSGDAPNEALRQTLRYDWSGAPQPGYNGDNFGVVFRRPIYIPPNAAGKATISIDVTNVQNGGVRVYILGNNFGGNADVDNGSPSGCSAQKLRWNFAQDLTNGGTYNLTTLGGGGGQINGTANLTVPTPQNRANRDKGWQVFDDTYITAAGIPNECLVIDRWVIDNDTVSTFDVRRTLQTDLPGPTATGRRYLVYIEFLHKTTGNARARIGDVNIRNINTRTNPDDGAIVAGNNSKTNANCNWGNVNSFRADSPQMYWEEYRGGNFPGQMVCYLELRGWVEVPTLATNSAMVAPKLTFWDVWDLQAGGDVWVEIANYDPNNDGVLDRATELDGRWTQVLTRSSVSNPYNYNWTYNSVDLTSFLSAWTNRKIAIRFGMRRTDTAPVNMKWYVDSLAIESVEYPTLFNKMKWNLDTFDEMKSFIHSGNWQLTQERTAGSMSFHDSGPNNNTATRDMDESRSTGTDDGNLRIHSIEFKGFVDLDDLRGKTDEEGDQGNALLTFQHSYDLGTKTSLEIQYSLTPYGLGPAVWVAVPNGGQIAPTSRTNASETALAVMDTVKINLEDIPARRFRLRFAMTVARDSTLKNGWWIDNIRLERDGRPKYLVYPFVDTAEEEGNLLGNYTLTGSWDRVSGGNRPATGETGFAYTDSPSTNYAQNTVNLLTFKNIFDLYNDTPLSDLSPACNLSPATLCNTTDNTLPVNPQMSFWHKRVIGSNITIAVEWKRTSENATSWRTLWAYEDGMTVRTVAGTPSTDGTRARRNDAWERIVVDLAPVYARLLADNATTRTDTNKEDDDINIRIRFQTRGGTAADGLYLDDVKVEERPNLTWALWQTGQVGVNGDGTNVTNNSTNVQGSGITYLDSLDNRQWFNEWHVGGGWEAISFDQRDGVLSFHDSVTDKAATTNRPPNFDFPEGNNGLLVDRTFNVLEMRTVFDLRGTNAADRPILYFWTRWYNSNRDYLSLQVSVEDPNNALGGCINSAPQCYQKDFGWGPWTTIWFMNNESREYLWQREQIDLSIYAKSGSINGKRIRLRFVTDSLDVATRRDGWYIDQLNIGYYKPDVRVISKTASNGTVFTDSARSTDNWITEGKWGLTPTIFKGSGGNASNLGGNPWQYQVWNYNTIRTKVTNCGSIAFKDCANTFLNNFASTTTPWTSGFVTEIRENWGANGPRVGAVTEKDLFVYRWTMTTPSNLVAGKYTLITAADDGVRLRYNTVPAGGLPAYDVNNDPPNYNSTWNIVDNWQDQARTTTISSARIEGLKVYQFVMEYYEGFGDASVQLSAGSFSFSFTSQPPNGSGRTVADQLPTMRNSNASMIYKGVFDLTQATNPFISYSTYYELGGNAIVEVSEDGGFTWQQTGLKGSPPPSSLWATNWYGYYYNTIYLDYQSGGWPATPPNFNTQPVTFNGAPRTRDDGDTINFNFGNNAPAGITGIAPDNFSVRWVRKLNTTDITTLTFKVTGDDGFRLWVNYTPGCAVQGSDTQKAIISGKHLNDTIDAPVNRITQRNATFPGATNAGCLIIDDWENQQDTRTATRSVLPGAVIMLEYYERTGGAAIRLEVSQGNFNDPTFSGVYMPDDGNWRDFVHDLTYYAGPGKPPISIRFRLDRRNETATDYDPNTSNSGTFNYQTAWWLADIVVKDP